MRRKDRSSILLCPECECAILSGYLEERVGHLRSILCQRIVRKSKLLSARREDDPDSLRRASIRQKDYSARTGSLFHSNHKASGIGRDRLAFKWLISVSLDAQHWLACQLQEFD